MRTVEFLDMLEFLFESANCIYVIMQKVKIKYVTALIQGSRTKLLQAASHTVNSLHD